jgi:WD40 repeat protein
VSFSPLDAGLSRFSHGQESNHWCQKISPDPKAVDQEEAQQQGSQIKMTTLKQNSFIDCGPPRLRSRSVAWNRSGHQLASASSCGAVRLNVIDAGTTSNAAAGSSSSKEIGCLMGHGGSVTIVRFHAKEDAILASAGTDGTVRLWDVRDQRSSTNKITESPGILSLEWNPVQSDLFLIAKRTGEIEIYDRRKLAATTTTTVAANNLSSVAAAYRHFAKDENGPRVPDAAIFEPTKGHTVYYGSTSGGEGTADIRLWPFMSNISSGGKNANGEEPACTSYLAHAGPIYTMAFRPDGRRLVTGGADAIVGIWDHVNGPTVATSMCCTRTIANRTKYIRSVAISSSSSDDNSPSCLLAIATEEGAIDIVSLDDDRDTTTAANSAAVPTLGQVPLGDKPTCAGAEAIAFHPTVKYMLACARVGDNASPLRIVRFETTHQQ